jgi:ABC-2 type transport system permease protein
MTGVTAQRRVVDDPVPRVDGARWSEAREVLQAEWTKLRTSPGIGWLLLTAAVLAVGISAATSAAVNYTPGTEQDPAKIALTGIEAAQAVVAVLAVLVISGEYSSGMIRTTLTAMPRRVRMLAAKATVITAPVLGIGVVSVLICMLVGRFVLPGNGFTAANGYSPLSLTDGSVLRAAFGSVLYLGLIALLALGVATAVRDTATAIGVVLALLYCFPIVSSVVTNQQWHRHLEQISPTAGLTIQATTDLSAQPLNPWAGLGVLAAWAAGALLLGGLVLRLRDA